MNLIEFTEAGLYCPMGKFYIDPWKPVDRAVISHGHSDHASFGHKHYLCHKDTKPIIEYRLGDIRCQSVTWNETIDINGVKVTLFPAGHVIGSSQIRIEYNGEVWVFSGDYKLEDDGISGAYEPIKCHTFITESTFGLPIYQWLPQTTIYEDMRSWVLDNKRENRASVFIAYSLGKAQRVLDAIKGIDDVIYAHGAIHNMQSHLVAHGLHNVVVENATKETDKNKFKNAIVVAPSSVIGSSWLQKFPDHKLAICSGWMQVRGNQRRRNADKGFALSDHCDFNSLLSAVKETEAETVYVTHGFQSVFSKYLNEIGIKSFEVKTQYGQEEETASTEETERL